MVEHTTENRSVDGSIPPLATTFHRTLQDFEHHTSLDRTRPSESRRMMTGKIKTLRAEKGFGFIRDEGGKEYFFHQSAIYGEGIDMLREGDSVEYTLGEDGPKGPRAENVRRTST